MGKIRSAPLITTNKFTVPGCSEEYRPPGSTRSNRGPKFGVVHSLGFYGTVTSLVVASSNQGANFISAGKFRFSREELALKLLHVI